MTEALTADHNKADESRIRGDLQNVTPVRSSQTATPTLSVSQRRCLENRLEQARNPAGAGKAAVQRIETVAP